MKKAVVCGGAGFIGSHVTDLLVGKGYSVEVIDDLSGGKREQVNPQARLHVCDVRDHSALLPIFGGADVVFHLAALPRVQQSIEHPMETNSVNIDGTVAVLTAARDAKVRRVVYSASSSAYGETATMPLQEDMPAQPLSPYGLQKYIGELYCRLFSRVYGMETVSLRYFNVYGPRMNADGAYALVIGRFFKLFREGTPLTITGDGTQTRDFTHVVDVARANILAAESHRVGMGEVINIGAGDNCSINRIAELIGGPVEYVPARLEPHDTRADNSRAHELLGWAPEIFIEEGIQQLKDN